MTFYTYAHFRDSDGKVFYVTGKPLLAPKHAKR